MRIMRKNPILCIDSYKLGHITMVPEGVETSYLNFTPRSLKHLDKIIPKEVQDDTLVAYGARLAIKEIHENFKQDFFALDIDEIMEEFLIEIKPFVGDNSTEVIERSIRNLHALGYLPLEIKWIAEGTIVPANTPIMTIKNTHSSFAWLPGYLETYISAEFWKRATSATIARAYRKILIKYAKETCDNTLHVDYQGHDFSARGLSGAEDFIKNGTAHLLSFKGTDIIHSATLIKHLYNVENIDVIGCSVPATEHSVMCLGSTAETEVETFRRLIKLYPRGIVSIVSDTWDFWDTITVKALELKEDILARQEDSLGLSKLVFRPDTGNPVDVICGLNIIKTLDVQVLGWDKLTLNEVPVQNTVYFDGNKYRWIYARCDETTGLCVEIDIDQAEYPVPEAEAKGAIECLWDIFGGSVNDKGFRVLNPKVGLIYGDSITSQRAIDICERLKAKGFASSNIVFGIGSYTYNYTTRDTLGSAIKATYAEISGKGFDIFKAPKTDSGKNSAKGLLSVVLENNKIVTLQQCTKEQEEKGLLVVGYNSGVFSEEKPYFNEIRARAQINL